MRIVVTGGAGQIGSILCGRLLNAGNEVVCVDNLSTGSRSNVTDLESSSGFTFVNADVSEAIAIDGPVDRIYHLASPASPPDYLRTPLATLAVNSRGTANLLRLADREHARFVFASTSEVYGDPEQHPQREEYWGHVNPTGVRSCYDEGKRFGEALTMAHVREGGTDARIVRIFNTFGPHSRPDDGRMVPNFICQALTGRPLTVYGTGNQTRSLCYVDDTVEGIISTMEADIPSGEVINIGNPEEHSVIQFAQMIAQLCGVGFQSVARDLPEDDPARRCPDISKARQLLDWSPRVSLQAGLENTIQWFRTATVQEDLVGAGADPG